MTSHGYTFDPIVDDESPGFMSRFAVPTGDLWLYGSQPVQVSQRITWRASESITVVVSDGILYVGPPIDLDLVLRPRRRGQRPAGTPRSAWWRLSRRERRQIGGAP